MVVDASWTIDDGVNTYTIDGVVLNNGWPDFRVGQEITLSFVFEKGNHTSRYDAFRDAFGQPVIDGLVVTGTDFNTLPYYSITQRPTNTSRSLLWELSPADRIDGLQDWWVVATSIDDETRITGVYEQVSVTMFVIAPRSEGNRTYIEKRYEEEL